MVKMSKILFVSILLSTVTFAYTLKEPQELVDAWQSCQLDTNNNQKCAELRPLLVKLHDNVELLQHNPQQMGLDIMNMQYQIQQDNQTNLQNDLEEKLAIVGWLESPL
jgi:hypothetical protein